MNSINPLALQTPTYSIGERVLRLCVYQCAVAHKTLEKLLIRIYKVFSQCIWQGALFDRERAALGLQFFLDLGAEEQYVTPQDGQALIHMLTLKAQSLDNKIRDAGGEWRKTTILDGAIEKQVFAIIPPANASTLQWRQLEIHFEKLGWNKKEVILNGQTREVIITCEKGENIDEQNREKNLLLHSCSAGTSSFVMERKRAGFYLGCKQNDICFFDARGKGNSIGTASEAGYYNDIDAVFDTVVGTQRYPHKNIWVTGSCGGNFAAAFIKHKHPEVNLILENGFLDLKNDFIAQESWLVRVFADHYYSSLKARDIEHPYKPQETGFNITDYWEGTEEGYYDNGSKVVLININNDQRVPVDVANRLVEVARRTHRAVHSVRFESSLQDPHQDRYFLYGEPRNEVLNIIFGH